VIGIAGSQEKCEHVTKNLGASACINYKTEDVFNSLKKLCPKGIDIYFDNVGGEILDVVLMLINDYARIICCGAISGYNSDGKNAYRLKNYSRLIFKRSLMQGFIYFDYKNKLGEATNDLMKLIKEGQVKFTEDFINGIDSAPKALQRLLLGENTGKVIVKVNGEGENIYETQ
jgi:NADPH-dependent curcumin reductase